jgi:SAM-dependent methyltransferase
MNPYSKSFYRAQRTGSMVSASNVVPFVIDLIRPRSVVDVGCGMGTWLIVFRSHGIEDILGVDGDYVHREMLLIPENLFLTRDLNHPFDLGRQFDLAVSLEVGEHLHPSAAAGYVRSLTLASKTVLFSAAIPGQGGVGHVNEQWPEYWRDLFAERDFVLIDCLRSQIWDNPNVEIWYRQNLLLFVEQNHFAEHSGLKKFVQENAGRVVSVVHPEMFRVRLTHPGLIETLQRLPGSVRTGIRRCFGHPY